MPRTGTGDPSAPKRRPDIHRRMQVKVVIADDVHHPRGAEDEEVRGRSPT
jgi:hypothetical protein